MMVSFLSAQKEILNERDLIAEIGVETITLTRLGGYNATPYSLNLNIISKPSAKSLKGVWRWWARAAVVGAHSGRIDYKRANELLNGILGSTRGVSRFWLEVSDVSFPKGWEDKLNSAFLEVDEFYKMAKEFLKYCGIRLPQKAVVKAMLNPSNAKIVIEGKNTRLDDRIASSIEGWISKGPFGARSLTSNVKFDRKNNKIVIQPHLPQLEKLSRIPRIKLLLMKRKDEEDTLMKDDADSPKAENYVKRLKEELALLISENLSFKVSLYGGKETDELNFAISSLLLSLILGGVGSITKRGFGSLRFTSYRIKSGLIDGRIIEILEKLVNGEFDGNELKGTLQQLCNIAIDCARKAFKVEGTNETEIPIVPSLSNIRIEVRECPSIDLVKVGSAFVKQEWKSRREDRGGQLHTWILGLPRFQNNTGYAIKEDSYYKSLRRISSIGVRAFKTKKKNFIIVYGMLSSDWPGFSTAMKEELLHISRSHGKRHERPVREIGIGKSLEEVFDKAFEEVLRRVC